MTFTSLNLVRKHILYVHRCKEEYVQKLISRKIILSPFYQTSNELERVHLLVIELKHPIFGFKQSNIELQT